MTEPTNPTPPVTETPNLTAPEFATRAAELMAERGKTYDSNGSERSMGKCVTAFNAITGRNLTEWEGWLLMSVLKRVRQASSPVPHMDRADEAVAHACLEAESMAGDDNEQAHGRGFCVPCSALLYAVLDEL